MEANQQILLNLFRKLLIGLFLLSSLPLLAKTEALESLVLSADLGSISAIPQAEYFEDKSRVLTLADVLTNPNYAFTRSSTTDMLAFGRTESAWWVHFSLVNQTDVVWYLLFDANLGEDLDLFIFPAGLSAKAINAELSNQFAVRLKDYPRYAWQLNLQENQLFSVYIRATNGGSVLNLPAQIMQANALVSHTFYNYRLVSIVFAGMLVLAAYQLLMFLVLRESSYLIIALYMLSMMLTLHRNTPIFEPLIFLSSTGAHFFTAPFFIVIAASAGFTREILNTAYYAPKLDWGFKALIVAALLSMVFVGFLPNSSNYPPLLGILLIPFTFFASLYVASKGYRLALYFTLIYLINLGVYLPILVVLIWDTSVWVPIQDVRFSLGALLFMLFLSIIQAERVRALREQVSQAELSNKAKDEFLAVMSHELRTPMNAVVGLGSLLKLTPLSGVQKIYIEKLEIATQHMMQLISNVLDFAKYRSANFQPVVEPFSLLMVLNSVAPLVEQQTEEKQLEFNLEISGSLQDSLLGDRLHLTQVLFNLLNNAIKYTDEGSITLKIVTKPKSAEQLQVIFTVIDTGLGIDPMDLPKLFEPFVQVQPSVQKREGVGLGLAITKRLVEIMDGTIKVDSALGSGSRFIIELNFALAAEQDTETQSLLTLVGKKLRLPQAINVLLIDDSELSPLVGCAMLRELGAKVLVAANSLQAKEDLKHYKADVIVLDLGCLAEAHLDCTVRLHEQTPIIGILANQTAAPAGESFIDVYLHKPFDYEELYLALLKALKLRQPSSPTE